MTDPTYSPEDPTGRAAGGVARAKSLTKTERSSIAKKAAAARWADVPEAICGSADKPLLIGDSAIECYVLEDGTRVVTQGSFLRALGRSRTVRRTDSGDEGLPPILQGQALKPFISDEVRDRAQPIPFNIGKTRALGYNAELLPDVCEAFLSARQAGTLPANQRHIAVQAEILVRGLSRVGIIALVDEATGYQDVRTKNALAKILEDFVAKEIQPYLTTFPPDFYKEMFRLKGLAYSADSVQRPRYFGIHTNDVVYKRLAPGVLEELKKVQEKTPAGNAKHKLFQRLTENVGYPKLREHLGSVVTLMKLSSDWDDFKAKLDTIHPVPDGQGILPISVQTGRRPAPQMGATDA